MLKSFKSALIALSVSLLVITVTIIMANSYYRARQTMFDISQQALESNTQHMVDMTANLISTMTHHLELLAAIIQEHPVPQHQESLLKFLWQVNQQSKFYSSVYVADATGYFLQAYKEPSLGTRIIDPHQPDQERHIARKDDYTPIADLSRKRDYQPQQRPWYVNTPNPPAVAWTDLYLFGITQQLGITVSYPVLDANGQKQAVIGIDISLAQLSQFITQQSHRQNNLMIIVNAKGQIMAMPTTLGYTKSANTTTSSPIPTFNQLHDQWIYQIYQLKPASPYGQGQAAGYRVKLDGKNYYAQLTPLQHDWSLFVILPEDVLLVGINKNVMDTIIIAVIATIVAVLSLYWMAGWFSNPIHQLMRNTQYLKAYRFNELTPIDCSMAEVKTMNQLLMETRDSLMAFDKYVPTELVKQIIQGHHSLELGGVPQKITLFVSALDHFSDTCLALDGPQQAHYLTRYQSAVSRVLTHEEATIATYMSDRILAFWGAPLPQAQSPQIACRAALACRQAMININRDLRSERLPPFTHHIALHDGQAIVGNFGSDHHMVYSAIGHQVNFCLYLANLNAVYGVAILISAPTYERVKKDFCCRWLDTITTPHESQPMKLYELIGWRDDPISIEMESYIHRYEHALTLLTQQQMAAAQASFQELLAIHEQDQAVHYHLAKINAVIQAG